MSTFNNVLDEIDYFRKSFSNIESMLFQNSCGTNQKSKRRSSSRSTLVNEKQVGPQQRSRIGFSWLTGHLNGVPLANQLPSDVAVPNSVVRNRSYESYRRDSSGSEQKRLSNSSECEQKRLSKDDIKALIKGAVINQMNKENETIKQSEANRPTKEQNKTRRTSTQEEMERRYR
ncbi:hypothetical protein LSTR_LSTR001414 [Laodelphax striatellus]|uniref:Uncharacterized protein n=1 Tax=Laodelphax striatellus TaxID=195883 RepID=A0A482XAB2_LAOST|nr:hypothetical protein LSTR_LSTR001414 [Laodelphax striatellus]